MKMYAIVFIQVLLKTTMIKNMKTMMLFILKNKSIDQNYDDDGVSCDDHDCNVIIPSLLFCSNFQL